MEDIYFSWTEASKQTLRFSSNAHRGFNSFEEVEHAWIDVLTMAETSFTRVAIFISETKMNHLVVVVQKMCITWASAHMVEAFSFFYIILFPLFLFYIYLYLLHLLCHIHMVFVEVLVPRSQHGPGESWQLHSHRGRICCMGPHISYMVGFIFTKSHFFECTIGQWYSPLFVIGGRFH